jgi:hypothetical protein
MALLRTIRLALVCVLLTLSFSSIANAQCSDCESIFEIDPAVALNGFAVLAAAIVVLIEAHRSKP